MAKASMGIAAPYAQIQTAIGEAGSFGQGSRFGRIAFGVGRPETPAETHGGTWQDRGVFGRAFLLMGAGAIAVTLGSYWCCLAGHAHTNGGASFAICRSHV